MLHKISIFIKLVFTDYLLAILIVSGLILAFFYGKQVPKDKFPLEYKISRIGGFLYIFLGLTLFIFTRFLG
ncbi:MAG: CLC_0170 family protein [Clostridia bacterium]